MPTIKQVGRDFDAAMKTPQRLQLVEQGMSWGRGYPVQQQALRNSAVVLTVAAWQALIEGTTSAVFDRLKQKAGISASRVTQIASTLVEGEVKDFNTPNMSNTKELFDTVGFALGGRWSVTVGGSSLNQDSAGSLINAWLQVRHSIAHGVAFHKNDKLVKLLQDQNHIRARVLTGKQAGHGNGIVLNASDVQGCFDLFMGVRAELVAQATAHIKAI